MTAIEEPVGKFILDNEVNGMRTENGVYYHYSDVCVLLKMYKASLWVSVDTRLPEVGESFLYFFISKVDKKKYQAVGKRTEDNMNKFLNSGMTHWQPLPQNPPTEE